MFDRKELIELRCKAVVLSETTGLSPSWRRAYLRLADAADHLDAMINRCTVTVEEDANTDNMGNKDAVDNG